VWRGHSCPRAANEAFDGLDSAVNSTMDTTKGQIEAEGYALVRHCVSEEALQALETTLDADRHGIRNLLSNAIVRAVAGSNEVRKPVASVLGNDCFAVRGILFNKNAKANWTVTWHQDCVIAVRKKLDIEGWGPWSRKAGVVHVRPAPAILEQMLAIRIHLDDCEQDNGPLRVISGSHRNGILSDAEIQNRSKDDAVACAAFRGDALLMRPLVLHSSSAVTEPSNRRVVHLEFAAAELPHGAAWQDCVRGKKSE
jgi:ectoine hydroxylase-related dioxygenase (phytanoyl-CoA dioxygenase family)